MACLTRIFKLPQIKPAIFTFTRSLTNHAKVTRTCPKIAEIVQNPWIYQQNDKIKSPIINKINFDLPNKLKWVPLVEEQKKIDLEIELPTVTNLNTPKQAVRLIVIRRNKMKRHKLKKLRKRMRFEWAKRRQRRELKKEKAFQAVLIKQCKDAEAFSAEKYVEDRLAKLNELSKLIESSEDHTHTLHKNK